MFIVLPLNNRKELRRCETENTSRSYGAASLSVRGYKYHAPTELKPNASYFTGAIPSITTRATVGMISRSFA